MIRRPGRLKGLIAGLLVNREASENGNLANLAVFITEDSGLNTPGI